MKKYNILVIIWLVSMLSAYGVNFVSNEWEEENDEYYLKEENTSENANIKTSIRLTSYYPNDSTGSTHYTGSGITTKDMKLNSKGFYTYKGKVVLAAATNLCLNITSGNDGCSKYNTKYDHIKYYDYYDEVKIEIDGIVYNGIILDSCGACMLSDDTRNADVGNRLDIFVKDGKIDNGKYFDRGYLGNNPVYIIERVK